MAFYTPHSQNLAPKNIFVTYIEKYSNGKDYMKCQTSYKKQNRNWTSWTSQRDVSTSQQTTGTTVQVGDDYSEREKYD